MPPSSRRSGTAHTSKGSKRSRIDRGQEDASSSSVMLDESSSSQLRQAETSEDDIEQLLQRLDQQSEPLSKDTSDAPLRALKGDWAGMEANFEIAYQLISDVAERLADARSGEGLVEEDENIQELDIGMRAMIDLHEDVKHRKLALEEIRAEVGKGDVRDAAGTYSTRTKHLDDDYYKKTIRQKYIHSDVYRKYKEIVWGALREDDMPPMADLLPHDSNDQEDDGEEDFVIYGGDRQKFKCPLTLQIMVEPLKSLVCPHAFEKDSILSYLGNQTKSCPSSCGKNLNKSLLKEDPIFTKACHKFARREQMRKETQKTQAQATMLD